jgi:CheY-like chemotaxis protein
MARGGNLRVEAVNLKLVEGEIYGLAAGSYIRVTVADDGPGIPSEHLKRLFEPYFSTKERGSGLGLSTAYSIIRNHGGTITVDSREGIGSTFDVYLQAATTAPDRGSAEGGVVEWKGSGRVLVMDDEDPVRETAGRMLERMGFEVDGAADGQEAVRRYRVARETGRPYRLVIMDLTVPGGMGGREAMQALRDYDPAACVIVSSGYSADAAMTEYASLGFRGVVPKPYSSEVLAEVVRKALVRPSPSP